MLNKESTQQLKEPLSFARNYRAFLKPDAKDGVILRTPPVEELMHEKELVLARLDGYVIIPMEAFDAMNIGELMRSFYEQVRDGQITK